MFRAKLVAEPRCCLPQSEMPTYALLGATGSTGSSILRSLLLQQPQDLTINAFVRSKLKLLAAFPDIEESTGNNVVKVNIYEGVPSDQAALQGCLKNVDVVLACIASNYSSTGMSLIYDTTTAVIAALESQKSSLVAEYKPPTIIQLRSVSLNPVLRTGESWIARNMAWFAFRYIYEDLERAGNYLATAAAASPKLLDYIFVDPPSIHDADGTTPTGYKLVLEPPQEQVLSYADLGRAFCEVAERRGEFLGRGVGVSATGHVEQTWGTLVGYMAAGVRGRIFG